MNSDKIKLIECPRDAMQSIKINLLPLFYDYRLKKSNN